MVNISSFFETKLQKVFDKKKFKNEKQVIVGTDDKKSSLWSDLHMNLSRKTINTLSFADQVRFHALCNRWLSLDQHYNLPLSSLPCFLSLQKNVVCDAIDCRLYEPFSDNLFSVNKINFDTYGIIPNTVYCTCKYGWLFMSILDSYCMKTKFLLFSCLTKKVITLPTLVHSKRLDGSKFVQAFSAEPSSPDCVFLVLHYSFNVDHRVTISTYRQGDEEWTSREFDRADVNYMCFGSSPVYIQGSFYFVSSIGEVASYNVALREWKGVRNVCNGIVYCNTGYETCELNGELVLIFFNDDEKGGSIRMFDWSEEVWVRLRSLDDQALFVSCNTFCVYVDGEEAQEKGVLPNKVYRLSDTGCVSIYSLENGDMFFHNCLGSKNGEKVTNCDGELAFWVADPKQLIEQDNETDSASEL